MSKEYQTYVDACKNYNIIPVSENSYKDAIMQAITRLASTGTTKASYCSFVVLKVGELLVKFKQISSEELEINFFSEDQYNLIKQYKEDV